MVHEGMHERAGQQEEPRERPEEMSPVLRDEIEAEDRDGDPDEPSRRQATLGPNAHVRMIVFHRSAPS